MNRYAVRIHKPSGRYPTDPLGFAGFAALVSDDVVWSVVYDPPELDQDCLGELYWLRPSEIRFLAAASLAEAHPRTNGRIHIHSGPIVGFVELAADEADDPDEFLAATRAYIADNLEDRSAYLLPTGDERRWRHVDRDYDDEVERLLDANDFSDPLLHRGLSKLLTANELRVQRQFLEEAGLAAFISREAALELLRRKLSERDSARRTREDVLAWIREEFPTGEHFVELLASDWEARVLMVHPVNEYGEFWTPPVSAEECMDAIHTLTYLYRFLLLDEPWMPTGYD